MAEAHPVGFRWVMKARERGAKIIHVDPRFARTSAIGRPARPDPRRHRHRVPRRADPPRARDRVLLQGVRPQLHERGDDRQRGLPGHRGPRRLFSGFDPETGHLRPHDVDVRGRRGRRARPAQREHATQAFERAAPAPGMLDGRGRSATRRSSTRAACFQILRRHYARYTPEMVERDLRHPARSTSSRSPRR